MNETRKKELIQKYFDKKLTPAEQAELDFWFKEISEQDAIWDSQNTQEKSELFSRMEKRILAEITIQNKPKTLTGIYKWSAVAAVFILVMGALFPVWKNGKTTEISRIEADSQVTRFVLLPDSSKVLLRPNSYIDVEFGDGKRIVHLVGEGFFDVRKNPDQPFEVYTGDVYTRVLGTKFLVRSMPDNELVVTVQEGKVSVNDNYLDTELALLTASQGIKINRDISSGASAEQDPISLSYAETGMELSWVNQDMTFDNEPLQEVILKLQKRYQQSISITLPELREQRVSGRFDGTETIDTVLNTLTSLVSATFSKENKQYQIHR